MTNTPDITRPPKDMIDALKDIGADDKMIEDIFIQGGADAYKPYYITKIQFE